MNALRHLLLALQFFTCIPLPGGVARWVGFSPAMQRASFAYFPLVGALVGVVGAGCFLGVLRCLPAVGASAWIAAILGSAATAMLTGAFHEDGLADLADGLGGQVSRERALEIMKDSRIGSYGSVALVLVLSLKVSLVAALAQVDAPLAAWALFAGHAFSRLMPVGVAAILPNAREPAASKSTAVTARVGWLAVSGAVFWALLALAVAAWRQPGLFWMGGMAACGVAWLAMCRLLRRRLQGFTGDALGATQQVCELAFYLGLLFGLSAARG
ncbi:MAG TPA: adenosylcobinamide-GDP ribazoletransferase [Bordetella sp.]